MRFWLRQSGLSKWVVEVGCHCHKRCVSIAAVDEPQIRQLMNLNFDDFGWLQDSARRTPSPNFNSRPDPDDISLLVIHNISLPPGEFGQGCVEAFFCNQLDHSAHPYFETIKGLEVSSHFLIDRVGNITQFVSIFDRAWHAGVSCFGGRSACNDYSIGIELEGTDEVPYSASQYQSLASLTLALMSVCPGISSARIVGHCDIAPDRKTDPGPAFDWEKYLNQVRSDSTVREQ